MWAELEYAIFLSTLKITKIKYLAQMHSFSSCSQVLHDIVMIFTQYFHNFHNLQAVKMIFSKFIIIFLFTDQNWAKYWTNLVKNQKKVGSRWVRGVHFFQHWMWNVLKVLNMLSKNGVSISRSESKQKNSQEEDHSII